LGGFFFFFYKEKKKPLSQHIADNVRCAALRTHAGRRLGNDKANKQSCPLREFAKNNKKKKNKKHL